MTQPFVIFGLPRSRTAWLSRFLTYGDWVCGHEELRHMRSLDDVTAWFSQPCTGTIETAGAPWWRMLDRFAPGAKVVIVRRPVADVVESLMRIPGTAFDRVKLEAVMSQLDRKLDQIAARYPGALSVQFDDLANEATCAAVFEHCLPLKHDPAHWARLAGENIQIDMRAMMRYFQAHKAPLDKLVSVAKHQSLTAMAVREPVSPDGITFQTEDFDTWISDATPLFDDHLVLVGEAPGDWQGKNLPLMRRIHDVGAMQIMTARCNGRMFGYLMTLITPSLTSENVTSAVNTTFYASPEFPGLGMKLQRAALQSLKERGVDDVFFETGLRGSGPRLSTMYRRLGASDHGQTMRLQLTGI